MAVQAKVISMAVNIKHNLFVDMPIITFKENGSFVSYVPFLFITGIGKTHDESVKDLMDGVDTYFHGEDPVKILKEKLPVPDTPISLELLRFNIENKKLVPATTGLR